MTLAQLLEVLPQVSDAPALQPGMASGVRYVDQQRDEFVEPPLGVERGDLSEAQVVVISAPAAVGKSMLAEHLAHRTSGVLWNLASFHVGNNFALGTLAQSHGPHALAGILDRIGRGSFVVIADAVDEARLRVSFDAFVAFLGDLHQQLIAPSSRGAPSVVLLARGETAEFAADWLEELGAAVARVRIDFFDREGAREFVDRQLRSEGKDPTTEAMARARESMFSQTLALLGAEADDEWPLEPARRFLGYAPVLVATTRFLARDGNPQRLAERLSGHQTPEAMWQFLIALIRDILEREQSKFTDGFRESVRGRASAAQFSAWDTVFTPDEQRSWLLSQALGTPHPELSIPQDIEAEYRAEVREWLEDHPLVGPSSKEFASPVFADYLYAAALVEGEEHERLAVRGRVADASYRPTEMLARFMFSLADGLPLAHAADLPALYESLAAGDDAGRLAELELTDEDGLVAAVTVGQDRVDLPLVSDGSAVSFNRKLARASIQLDGHGVRLGLAGRPFDLGPDVALRAQDVEIAAESLVVHGGIEPAGAVVLAGASIVATDPAFRIIRGSEHLRIRAAQVPRYPLASLVLNADDDLPPLGTAEREASRVLFRLFGFFKSEGYGGLGAYAEPIDRRAGQNEAFARMLSFARDRGLITQEGGIYKLHPEPLGLDYLKVKAQALTPEAAQFLRDFANKRRGHASMADASPRSPRPRPGSPLGPSR